MGLWNFQPLKSTETNWYNQTKIQHWEQTQLSGYPIKYIKAVELENNTIFSESTSRDFINTNGFVMAVNKDDDSLYNGSEAFGGFGYTPSYTNIFYIPIKYFEDINETPIEGDLVYETIGDILYEITKVDTKTEGLQSIETNDMKFSYKVYLKQYNFSYKDKFDSTLEDEVFDDVTNLEELELLNASLNTDIQNTGNIGTDTDDVFGDLS